jgi:hypothetical protein
MPSMDAPAPLAGWVAAQTPAVIALAPISAATTTGIRGTRRYHGSGTMARPRRAACLRLLLLTYRLEGRRAE